ncbi:MAG: nuclear transport factor 2 family protein [Candidatus Sulfotelmatobacter sp.]
MDTAKAGWYVGCYSRELVIVGGLDPIPEPFSGHRSLAPQPDFDNRQVTVLDVAGNIASAKLVTPGWTDYMTLTKLDGEWKILSVVQGAGPADRFRPS